MAIYKDDYGYELESDLNEKLIETSPIRTSDKNSIISIGIEIIVRIEPLQFTLEDYEEYETFLYDTWEETIIKRKEAAIDIYEMFVENFDLDSFAERERQRIIMEMMNRYNCFDYYNLSPTVDICEPHLEVIAFIKNNFEKLKPDTIKMINFYDEQYSIYFPFQPSFSFELLHKEIIEKELVDSKYKLPYEIDETEW